MSPARSIVHRRSVSRARPQETDHRAQVEPGTAGGFWVSSAVRIKVDVALVPSSEP